MDQVRYVGIPAVMALLVPCTSAVVEAQMSDSIWTIKSGTFAGQTVAINASAASKRSSGFWRVSSIAGGKRVVGWNPSRLPARVAFRPGRNVSAADSIAFWDILQQMQADMGMRLFEPGSLTPESDPDDIIVVDTKPMTSSDGLTLVTWGASGLLYDARVYLRSTETLHSPRTVTHEMMHALGFGHTAAWTSVMNGYGGGARGLTLEDVAYAQFALESRVESEREDMWERLSLAVEREPQPAELKDGITACPIESGGLLMGINAIRRSPWPGAPAVTAVMSCNSNR